MKKIRLGNLGFAIVDDKDYIWLSKHRWWAAGSRLPYAQRREERKGIRKNFYMAREIIQAPPYLWVDHINGDTLDNRKCNLRLCSRGQNAQHGKKKRQGRTHSIYKGVTLRIGPKVGKKKWWARIMANGKYFSLKSYETELEAALAYNEAAKKYHGEYALLNKVG